MERFSRTLRGYDPEEVNRFLDKVIAQVETMVEQMKVQDKQIKAYKEMEKAYVALRQKSEQFVKMEDTLKRAIVMAEKTSEQIKLTAYQERDIIVGDAKKNANRIINESLMKAEDIQKQADNLKRNVMIFRRRIKDALETQLQLVDEIEKIELD